MQPTRRAPQDKKTEIYKRIVEETAEARPGVLELMDEALARDDIALCICSAATKAGFEKVGAAIRLADGGGVQRLCFQANQDAIFQSWVAMVPSRQFRLQGF
jgi:hypothetical protein